MTPEEKRARIQALGRVLYVARMKTLWGAHWTMKDVWPADDEAWREYPHHPIAAVDLILAEATAGVEWMAQQ